MMLYKNTKVKVHSPDWDTDYFDIIVGVLRVDTLVPYLFIICQDYVLRASIVLLKEKWLYSGKTKKQTIPRPNNYNYVDDIALLANTPAQAESLLHSLEPAAVGIGIHVNADKTEFKCFNQRGDISTLNDGSLKLVN